MMRLHLAATAVRALRALVSLGAVLVLALAAGGCVGGSAPAPTPDPFGGLADRSDQAFRQGLEAYGQGQYREALTAFERARVLSPTTDPRIEQMIERARTAMAPTPTPIPPTPTSVPAAPTAVPVAMNVLAPDADLGRRYFGQVTLAVVPGREADAPAATQFFFQDQIGLRIEGLRQHLRLPLTLRVFNTDASRLVAEVQSSDDPRITAALTTAKAAPSQANVAATLNAMSDASTAGLSPTATPAAVAEAPRLARFWDTYVWYHQGGEEPGRYRAELYANGVLTHTFDYSVGIVPIATPEIVKPTLEATPSLPEKVEPSAPKVEEKPRTTQAAPKPAAPKPTPEPTPIPQPTPVPTPAMASGSLIGGLPAGLDVNANDGRVFIADGSGVIWTTDPQQPNTFNRPSMVSYLPVDLAVDQTAGRVFVSARRESAVLVLDNNGRLMSTIPMPVAPGDLQVDSELGLVYVVLPERQALGVIDSRAGRLVRTIGGLPQITSLALDPYRHTLYAAHLAGQLTIIDVPSSQVTARVSVSGVGLASVSAARGLAYAVNTASHELAVVEPISQTVARYVLTAEPAAVAAAEDTGSVYVLATRPNAILRLDPTDGTELGRVSLPDRSGRFGVKMGDKADFQGMRSRMVLNRADDTVYVTLPEVGSLSVVPTALFPPLTRDIPWVEAPEPAVVAMIPGVIRPGAPPLPAQPAPNLVAQIPSDATSDADEEAN